MISSSGGSALPVGGQIGDRGGRLPVEDPVRIDQDWDLGEDDLHPAPVLLLEVMV